MAPQTSSESNKATSGKELLSTSATTTTIPLVELSMENVTYAPMTTRANQKSSQKARKTILHKVTTSVRPYTLTAWMGPSGSGYVVQKRADVDSFLPLSRSSCILTLPLPGGALVEQKDESLFRRS